jgi:hypothetical protein
VPPDVVPETAIVWLAASKSRLRNVLFVGVVMFEPVIAALAVGVAIRPPMTKPATKRAAVVSRNRLITPLCFLALRYAASDESTPRAARQSLVEGRQHAATAG